MPTLSFIAPWNTTLGGTDFSAAARVTTPTFEGEGALRLQPTGAVAYWEQTSHGSQNVCVTQMAINFAAFPTNDIRLFHVSANLNGFGIAFDSATGQVGTMVDDSFIGGVGGPVLELNRWYLLDLKIDLSNPTPTADARINGIVLPQTAWSVAQTYTTWKIGPSGSTDTFTLYVDPFYVSHALEDYPLILQRAIVKRRGL